ncbi:hypothetical protein VTJ83DRAFT_1372 [Remersonia thermophila]|uniref:PhnB-like domain-containing protein n=1 Tax=Remersonia thermophila TaxID=72144 RepID=A0ABR4DPU8_9PEZI
MSLSSSKLKLTTCLWFDGQAQEAAEFYTSIFPNSKIVHVQNHLKCDEQIDPNQTVLVVAFELDGNQFFGLNGGPMFKFNEAISFQIDCANQEEVDYYFEKLSEGGDKSKQVCGWLADKYGVSWQIVPTVLKTMLASEDKEAAARVSQAMSSQVKLNIAELEKAFKG